MQRQINKFSYAKFESYKQQFTNEEDEKYKVGVDCKFA